MPARKQALREMLKERRACIPPAERERLSAEIGRHLERLLEGYGTVMVYASKPPEVDTLRLIPRLIAAGIRVVVPIIQRQDCSLRLSYLDDPAALRTSTFNVPEPVGSEIPVRPADVEVAIIPLIGFDPQGNRIGYGAGYYDRFLEANPHIVTIGVGFSCQGIEEIPCEELDIRMDIIVTEHGAICCGDRPPRDAGAPGLRAAPESN